MKDKLKIRIKFPTDSQGISIAKLAAQMEKLANLAESIARDMGIDAPISEWRAGKFRNASVAYDMTYYDQVSDQDDVKFTTTFNGVLDFKPRKCEELSHISNQTIASVNAFAQTFSDDDTAVVTLPNPGKKRPKVIRITRQRLEKVNDIIRARDELSDYYGSVVGYLYEWNIGAKQPFIKIRDIATNDLVKCSYKNISKDTILKLFEVNDQLIIAYGKIICDLTTGKPEIKEATEFELAPKFSQELYESFPGLSPDFTDGEDAAEYIRGLRGDN